MRGAELGEAVEQSGADLQFAGRLQTIDVLSSHIEPDTEVLGESLLGAVRDSGLEGSSRS